LGLPVDGTLIGFFAQIVSHKGAIDLVRACSRVMADDASLGVVIAGDGPPPELRRLREEIAATEHSDRLIVLPPQEDVGRLLAAVDMVGVPSRWPDPLPRSVMEAMAAGKPVVAYRTGGVPEMVVDGETGVLVESGDLEGLARGIARLAGDSAFRQRLGAAAFRRARSDFSFESHVDGMERVLLECARTGSGGGSGIARTDDHR
jgi:glycosyltransferase involved in cell wall biosynthesis